jgi:hypothetical protein
MEMESAALVPSVVTVTITAFVNPHVGSDKRRPGIAAHPRNDAETDDHPRPLGPAFTPCTSLISHDAPIQQSRKQTFWSQPQKEIVWG